MQILLEGLAMGAFANLHANARDPLLKRLVQLVMTDEAFHHKFGKIWADRTMPRLSRDEHERVEDWTAQVFEMLLFNLSSLAQRGYIYEKFGLDLEGVARVGAGGLLGRPQACDAREHQRLPRAGQDAVQGRHHHRPHDPCIRRLARHRRHWKPRATR